MSILADQLAVARRAAGITQQELATKSGVSRMTVQRVEAGVIDPHVDTLLAIARVLGLEPLFVPASLRAEVINYIQSGGKVLGQQPGLGAPLSIVDELLKTRRR